MRTQCVMLITKFARKTEIFQYVNPDTLQNVSIRPAAIQISVLFLCINQLHAWIQTMMDLFIIETDYNIHFMNAFNEKDLCELHFMYKCSVVKSVV